jgi:hypothetical protein
MSENWLAVRNRLRTNRFALTTTASTRYPGMPTLAGTPLLTRPEWIPERPLPLSSIDLHYRDAAPPPTYPAPLPAGHDTYSAAVAALDPPAVFENRPVYRLLDADLRGPRGRLVFGTGRYFDGIDVGEAAAHELAAGGPTPLRDALGDPRDLDRRVAGMAVSALTVRDGSPRTVLLHWRDPDRVGHAGGLHQVVPVGVFQPPGFSLWTSLLREFAEEVLGAPESAPVPAEFADGMATAVASGSVRPWCVGLGVDPLTFATDLLVVVVVSASAFDELFGGWVTSNDEGVVFSRELTHEILNLPLQAAGSAVIRRALALF